MLFLVFQLGTDRYAIEAAQVVEVLPLVNAKHIPHAPPGVAGILNYHGMPVPLIDLTEISQGTPSRKRMSTRIVLIHHRDKTGEAHLVGFLAEHATETRHWSEEDFKNSGVTVADAPYLGSVITDKDSIIQRIDAQNLLPDSVGSQLFRGRVGSL
jgi:chemotaxis-related protein WspB